MAVVDEALQQPQHDRVADVQVGRGRVQAEIDAQRAAPFEPRASSASVSTWSQPSVRNSARSRGVRVVDVIVVMRDVGHAVGERSSNTVTPPPPSSALP